MVSRDWHRLNCEPEFLHLGLALVWICVISWRSALAIVRKGLKMAQVASQKQSVTVVNAAFLQELKDSNTALWSTLRALRSIDVHLADVREATKLFVTKLGELRDCLAFQFSLEETYGYLEGVKDNRVRWQLSDAAEAKRQHSDLYLQIHELCEQAEEAQYRGTIGRDFAIYLGAFETFDLCLSAHEDLEAQLIQCGLGL